MLGKIINGTIVSPSENEKRKIIIANPTEDILKLVYGYKTVTEGDKPQFDRETQYLRPVYTETESEISVLWEVCDFENTENSQPNN